MKSFGKNYLKKWFTELIIICIPLTAMDVVCPEEYIDYALTAGLSEIGFSDHLSVNHNLADNNMNPANISSYINHILKTPERD